MTINKDYTYAPGTRTVTTTTSGGSTSASSTTVHRRRRIYERSDNDHNPKVSGWRSPSAHNVDYYDYSTWFFGTLSYLHKSSGSTVTITGYPDSHSIPSIGSIPSSYPARVELDALLKLKDAKVNLGVSFGERKEAAGLMLDRLGKIAKAYKEFRRGNFRNAARSLGLGWKDAPRNWLEYQYGWKPLLGDIYTACDEISKKDMEEPKRASYYVKSRKSFPETSRTVTSSNSLGVRKVYFDEHTFDVQVRFDFSPKAEMGHLKTLDQWGILNPLEIAWELTPFSFVVDWAVPVGQFISALSAAVPYNFLAGSQTRFLKAHRLAYLEPGDESSTARCLYAFGRGDFTRRRMTRIVYVAFPFPNLRALAASRNPTSQTIATRTANAVSLIAEAVRR